MEKKKHMYFLSYEKNVSKDRSVKEYPLKNASKSWLLQQIIKQL